MTKNNKKIKNDNFLNKIIKSEIDINKIKKDNTEKKMKNKKIEKINLKNRGFITNKKIFFSDLKNKFYILDNVLDQNRYLYIYKSNVLDNKNIIIYEKSSSGLNNNYLFFKYYTKNNNLYIEKEIGLKYLKDKIPLKNNILKNNIYFFIYEWQILDNNYLNIYKKVF